MNKLIVLDYSVGSVDIWDTQKGFDDIDDDYVSSLGFRVKDCEYMIATESLITFHKEILK